MPPPAITLGGVSLPGDLRWTDEFAWSSVTRSAEYSLTGALIVEAAVKQAGRPITLAAAGEVWINATQLAALYALAETPGWTGTLVLANHREFTVAFRDEGVAAEPVVFQAPSGARDDWWQVTLKLIEV